MLSKTEQLARPQGVLVLKKGREKPLLNRHPWIFSGAIDRIEGDPTPGDAVSVITRHGDFIGLAGWNPASQITGRMMTWEDRLLDDEFWEEAIAQSIGRRQWLDLEPETTGYRLINGESDGIPGLIVDKYDRYLVFQCLTKVIDVRKQQIIEHLKALTFQGQSPLAIVERSDASVRKLEGLPQIAEVVFGEIPEGGVWFKENQLSFKVDLVKGHKSGFYLDQRDNRAILGLESLVKDKDVLNCFAYTGGFSAYAASANAKSVTSVDTSVPSLTLAEENVQKNSPDRPQDEYLAGNVFDVLRHYQEENVQFDVIVLDPPKFAHSAKDIKKATRGYRDINLLGMSLLRPGGTLLTFSCSGLISADLFQKVVFGAAVDAGRQATVLKQLNQSNDHVVSLHFPEGHYLKGLMLEIR